MLQAKLTKLCRQYIQDHAAQITSSGMIRAYLKQTGAFDKTPSLSSIRKVLKQHMGISFQKASFRPAQVTLSDYRQLKADISKILLLMDYLGIRLIFIDEYSVHAAMGKQYAWAPKGKGVSIIT